MNLEGVGTDRFQLPADRSVEIGNQNFSAPFVPAGPIELAEEIDAYEHVGSGLRCVGLRFLVRINNDAAKLRAALLDPDTNTSGRVCPNTHDSLIRRSGLPSMRRIRCKDEGRAHDDQTNHSFSFLRQNRTEHTGPMNERHLPAHILSR